MTEKQQWQLILFFCLLGKYLPYILMLVFGILIGAFIHWCLN